MRMVISIDAGRLLVMEIPRLETIAEVDVTGWCKGSETVPRRSCAEERWVFNVVRLRYCRRWTSRLIVQQ